MLEKSLGVQKWRYRSLTVKKNEIFLGKNWHFWAQKLASNLPRSLPCKSFNNKKVPICLIFTTFGDESLLDTLRSAESEKPRRRIGIADRKVFARPESFCAYQHNWFKIKSKHSINLKSFWTVWNISGQSRNMTNDLESFQTV